MNQSYNVNDFTWDAFGKTTVYLEATAVDVINLYYKVDQFNTSNWVTVDTVKITTVEQDLTPTECRPDTHVTEQNTVVLENYISVDINGQRGGYNALHYDSADPALFNQNVVESQVFFTGNAVAVRQNNRWALWDYVNGALQPRPVPAPGPEQGTNAWVVTMQVDDYDDVHERLMSAGATVAMPKFALPGMAWQGYYLDTEGNTIGIHQADESAA